MQKAAYTINQGSKTVGLIHGKPPMHFIIGFRNVRLARHIQYNMHPVADVILHDCIMDKNVLIPKDDEDRLPGLLTNDSVFHENELSNIYMGRLSISKQEYKGGPYNPMNDGSFHLTTINYKDLLKLPFTCNVGIVLPNEILVETKTEIELNASVILAMNDVYRLKML